MGAVEVRPFQDEPGRRDADFVPTVDDSDLGRIFRHESGRAVATLVRLFGDIDIAEEAVQEAFVVATQRLAGVRTAAEPGRVDHDDRSQSRHRQARAVNPPVTTDMRKRRSFTSATNHPNRSVP